MIPLFIHSTKSSIKVFHKISIVLQILAISLLFFSISDQSSLATNVDNWLPPVASDKNVDQSISRLQKNLKAAPGKKQANLHYQLGCLYRYYKNDNKSAIQHFEKALETDPQNIGALFMLSGIWEIRADFRKSLEYSLKICEIDPNHPLAELAAKYLATLLDYVPGYNAEVAPVYERVLNASSQVAKGSTLKNLTNVEFQYSLRQTLLRIYRHQGKTAKADTMRKQIGGIENWLIIGPFGKFEALSFDETFAPEIDEFPRESYQAERGIIHTQKFTFRNESVSPVNKRKRGGTYYAISYINLPKAQDVVARLYSTSSIKLFINNQLIYKKDRMRNWTPAEELIGISIPSGWNKITVKFTSRVVPGSFAMFLSDKAGSPLNPTQMGKVSFDESSGVKKYPPLNKEEVKTFPVEGTARAYLENLLQQRKSNPWIWEQLSHIYRIMGDQYAQKEALLKAIKLNPNYSSLHYSLGLLYRKDVSSPSKIGASKARAEFKRSLDLAKDNPHVLYQLALLDKSDDRDLDAINKLQKCVEKSPEFPTWQQKLFQIYNGKGWDKEAEDALSRELQLNPEGFYTISSARSYSRQKGNFQKYIELTRKIQKLWPEPIYLSDLYKRIGRYEMAIKEYSKCKELMPNRISVRRQLVNLYRITGQFEKAEAEIKELLKLIPDDPTSLSDLATLYYSRGDKTKAVKLLTEASKSEPSDYKLRRALMFLGEHNIMDDYAIDLSDVLADRPKGAEYGNVSSVLLLDQFILLINDDMSSYERAHIIVKVLNKKGIEKWGEINNIPSSAEILSLRVVKPDGTVSEPELITGKSSISMADLAPGDIVEYEYVVARGKRYSIPNSYFGITFTFQSVDVPTEHAQLVVITPKDLKLDFFGTRGITENYAEFKPKVKKREVVSNLSQRTAESTGTDHKTYSVYVWERKGTERILSEPMSVSSRDYLPYVQVASNITWDDVSLSYQNSLIRLFKMSHEMHTALGEITQGIKSEYEKIRAVYNFVNEKIKGRRSTLDFTSPAHNIFAQKSGNRLVLMKAFLDALGISSEVILVHAITAAQWPWKLASPNAFHTAFLKVNMKNGRTIWLDLSMRKTPFGYVPPYFRNTIGLRVGARGNNLPTPARQAGAFIETPPSSAEDDLRKSVVTLKVDKNGDAEGDGTESFSGVMATMLRGIILRMPAYVRKQYADRIASQMFRGATVSSFKLINLDDPDKPFIINYNFTVKNFGKKESKGLTLDRCLPPLDLRRRYIRTPMRKLPMLISMPNNYSSSFTITCPPGSKPKVPSQGLTIGNSPQNKQSSFGTYSLKFSREKNVIRISRKYFNPIMRIKPADYARFADFCAKVDEAERFEITVEMGK